MPVETLSSGELRGRAGQLADGYPALLAEAQRVANIVAAGVHGRRRPGQGETFWQYRNYDISDPANRIDWRRSARGDQTYVRDTEWEAANSVYIWRDGGPNMAWRSSKTLPTKRARASVLSLALMSLLLRGGERCAVLGASERLRSGRAGLIPLSETLAQADGTISALEARIPRHAKLLLASDFLTDAPNWPDRLARLAARPTSAILLHIIDPAEDSFPFDGRVEFEAPSGKRKPLLLGRAERARADYQSLFVAHCERIDAAARRLGFPIVRHRTDQPAAAALATLYQLMGGDTA